MASEDKWILIMHPDSPEDAPVEVTATAFSSVWMDKGWTMVDGGAVTAFAAVDDEDLSNDNQDQEVQ